MKYEHKYCACGCGSPVPNHRNFQPGHDSLLLSKLCKEYGGIEGIAKALKNKKEIEE